MFAWVWGVFVICATCLWPTDAPPADAGGLFIDPQALLDTGLVPAGDNFTWQNHPDHNHGTNPELRTGFSSGGRAFVHWDQATIVSVLGPGTLVSAWLDLSLVGTSGWGPTGGVVGVYRVTRDWTELGSTAHCAIDTDTSNELPDCSGETAWVLNDPEVAPWVAAFTDTVTLTNGQMGTVSFDVTGDVQAFLEDTANYGWVVKPHNDAAAADVRFHSREGATPPLLVLTVDSDTGRPAVPDGFTSPDSAVALLVSPPGQPDVLVLRDFIHIEFDDTTSGARIRAVFQKYNAAVVGGYPETRTYVVQIPDPGPTYAALESVLGAIEVESGVRAAWRRIKQAPEENLSRYPSDGPLGQRQAWIVTVDADTSRPPVPEGFSPPDSAASLWTSPPGQPDVLVLRDFFTIAFDDSTSGTTVKAILAKYNAEVAGGWPLSGAYVVRIPDPGPTYAALESVLKLVNAEIGVRAAYRSVMYAPGGTFGRFPDDGLLSKRGDWTGTENPPPVPSGIALPEPLLQVNFPADTSVAYARNALFIQFEDTTGAATIRAILLRYQGQIIGGYPRAREYEIQIPDPGTTYQALDSIINVIGQEAGVYRVRALELRTRIQTPARYPNDDAGAVFRLIRSEPGVFTSYGYVYREPNRDPIRDQEDGTLVQREDWLSASGTAGTRALRAIRAPQAWSGETGPYRGPVAMG